MWYNRGNIWFWQFSKLLKIGGGAHYYWPAATAASGRYSTGTYGVNVNDSICPKGWKLPTGGQAASGNQFADLLVTNASIGLAKYTDSTSITNEIMEKATANPYSYVRSGEREYSGNLISVGYGGSLTTSTINESSFAFSLDMITNRKFHPGTLTILRKGSGYPIRCIADDGSYSINYHANGGSAEPSQQTGRTETSLVTVTLSSAVPTRHGYTFAGWATSAYATTAEYASNSTITLPVNVRSLDLYAVWSRSAGFNAFWEISTMQQMTAEICQSAPRPGVTNSTTTRYDTNGTMAVDGGVYVPQTTLTDSRDGKRYIIRKLADGNCWMSQNLDLDIATGTTSINGTSYTAVGTYNGGTFNTFTNKNSDISSSTSTFANGDRAVNGDTIIWTVPTSTSDKPSQVWSTQKYGGSSDNAVKWNSYGCAAPNGSAETYWNDNSTSSTYCRYGYEIRSYDVDVARPELACFTGSGSGSTRACSTGEEVGAASVARLGNHYNWPAATAGSGTYSTSSDTNAPDSICPKGWQNPDGTKSNRSYYYLLLAESSFPTYSVSSDSIGDAQMRNAPLDFVRAGQYFSSGYVLRSGTDAYYSTRTLAGNGWIRFMSFYSSSLSINPNSNNNRGPGYSIRCVAQ